MKVRMMVRLVLALTVLAGCARAPLVLTVEGDADVQQAVLAASAEWASCGVDVRVGPGGMLVREGDVGEHGGAESSYGIVYRRQTTQSGMQALMTHEIGHALGLGHTPAGEADIMAAVETTERHVRPEDCALLQ